MYQRSKHMDKELTIYRARVTAYLASAGALFGLLLVPLYWVTVQIHWGIGLLLVVLYLCGVAYFSVAWVKVLRYRLTDKALLVEKGIWFKSRKTIPLDKITDLELVQGPLLRVFGMWIIKIQTAGTASQTPVAMLLGMIEPEQIREEILAAKTAYLKS